MTADPEKKLARVSNDGAQSETGDAVAQQGADAQKDDQEKIRADKKREGAGNSNNTAGAHGAGNRPDARSGGGGGKGPGNGPGRGKGLGGGGKGPGNGPGNNRAGQKGGGNNAAPVKPKAPEEKIFVAPPAPVARVKKRHWGVIFSFILFVMAPIGGAGWYLWERAAPRYVSYAGFSVRTEETSSAADLLGNISSLSGSSSSDTDILYNFIRSQEMVRFVDAKLDLRMMWSKADPDIDPVFAFHAPGNIESLTKYWTRMVGVYNDSGSGLIDMAVQAFTPEDAQMIAEAIYDESSAMINRLSSIARDDAIDFAREELTAAETALREARLAVNRFRTSNQIVDPTASIQGQTGLIASLQGQLAEAIIGIDVLKETARESDPRIVALQRRVDAIEKRIVEEREKVGVSDAGEGFADLVDQYERLSIDLSFTEETYTVARAAFSSALAESRRQNRYLAAHVRPTIAESSEQPHKYALLGLISLFVFLTWSLFVLISYAIKDRR